jgi:HK97 family phage major capsid protein
MAEMTGVQRAKLEKMFSPGSGLDFEAAKSWKGSDDVMGALTKAADLSGNQHGGGSLRVKSVDEAYSKDRKIGRHVKTGEAVTLFGKPVELPSELQTAKTGAFIKFIFHKSGVPNVRFDEHDEQLLELCFRDEWIDASGKGEPVRISGETAKSRLVHGHGADGIKASLLQDNTSGGLDFTPAWLDADLLSYPLLAGELLPGVTVIDAPRSNRADRPIVNHVTVSWGTAEGTPMTPFDATALFDLQSTNVWPVSCALITGLDTLADASINVGAAINMEMQKALASELDKMIAVGAGDGSYQPQGIFHASGTNSVSSTNGSHGALTYSDALKLYFGINKAYRGGPEKPIWLSRDSEYRIWKSIATGVSGDERPLFGMDIARYEMLDCPYRVQNDITSGTVGFGLLSKYRMYKRPGLSFLVETGGITLRKANEALLLMRGRFGGQLSDPNSFCVITNASVI